MSKVTLEAGENGTFNLKGLSLDDLDIITEALKECGEGSRTPDEAFLGLFRAIRKGERALAKKAKIP